MSDHAAPGPAHHELCTIFDSGYLFRAVALHESLLRHSPSFRLTALCVDERSARLLSELALPRMRVMPVRELEAARPRLASVKHDRTVAEYCWTAKSALLLHMLETEEMEEATYLDADLLFHGDPQPLFDELGDDSVLITPHRYLPRYDIEDASGTYNAGYLTFRADERGMRVLRWWHDRCVEWCYARHEDGRSGDQKYLDDWTERFEGVRALRHRGGALAPWNLERYSLRERDGRIWVDGDPLVFFHYHRAEAQPRTDVAGGGGDSATRLPRGGAVRVVPPAFYRLSGEQRGLLYTPYERALNEALGRVREVDPGFSEGIVDGPGVVGRARRRVGMAVYVAAIRLKRLLRRR